MLGTDGYLFENLGQNLKRSHSRVLAGHALLPSPPPSLRNPDATCLLFGQEGWFGLDRTLFSKHIMVIGSIGSGKTNAIYQMVDQIQQNLNDESILIIFDTKGDFYERFYNEKSVVISNDETATGLGGEDYWNVFRELMADSDDPYDKSVIGNAMEVATSLFAEKLKKTNQPFFPQAARDLMAAIMVVMLREAYEFIKKNGEIGQFKPHDFVNNAVLREYTDRATSADIINLISRHDDMANIKSYISAAESPQTQGVLSEMQQAMREFFIGNYQRAGTLSMRELVRAKGGVTVFVEYDIAYGATLAPVLRLLMDLALKEAMGRKRTPGDVWVIIDEFSLLPNLKHIANALNFGRSLGLKIILGLQNFNQLIVSYEEAQGRSIASGCSSYFIFRVTDQKTKEFVQGIAGKHLRFEAPIVQDQLASTPSGQVKDTFIIDDWVLSNLPIGGCIVSLPNYPPFLSMLDLYDPKKLREKVSEVRRSAPSVQNKTNGKRTELPFAQYLLEQ